MSPATGASEPRASQWPSVEARSEGAVLGVWIFLVTEQLLFGGLFTAYALYGWLHAETFGLASRELDVVLGTANTAILLTSSATMAFAVRAARIGRRGSLAGLLATTVALGAVFLTLKGLEYHAHWTHRLVPGPDFEWTRGGSARSAEQFFSLYFAMTGLHAIHVLVGMGLLSAVALLAWRGRFRDRPPDLVEGAGLYWHLVDVVWLFLFPLLYLFSRAGS